MTPYPWFSAIIYKKTPLVSPGSEQGGFLKNNSIKISCDVAIAQADANIFGLVKSKKNFLLSHSVQKFEKFFRKNQAFPFIKYRPKVIVASNYHYKTRSFLTSFYGKIKLFWSNTISGSNLLKLSIFENLYFDMVFKLPS